MEPFHLKKIIGHASVQMTYDVYGHMFPEDDTHKRAVLGASEQFSTLIDGRPLLANGQERDKGATRPAN